MKNDSRKARLVFLLVAAASLASLLAKMQTLGFHGGL